MNAALTLRTIADISYSPDSSITATTLPAADEETGTKPITYTLSPALPVGLMFSTETRMITGTAPTAEQTSQYTYTAEDANGALAAQTFTLSIKSLELNISNRVYIIGSTVNETLPAADGGTSPITYTLSPAALPKGLTFSTATRLISGRPTDIVITEYTYTATDALGSIEERNFILAVITETSDPAQGYGGISDSFKIDSVTTLDGGGTQTVNLPASSRFGASVADMGDIDKDGINDLAVGASLDDSGGRNRGAVYILFMNADNTIKNSTKIIHDPAGIELTNNSIFGISVANIGDFDGDKINELAVGTLRGAIYILHLNRSGELDSFSKIDVDDINNILDDDDSIISNPNSFGVSIANLGDIDGDGVIDLAVGAHNSGDQRKDQYIFYLWIKPKPTAPH